MKYRLISEENEVTTIYLFIKTNSVLHLFSIHHHKNIKIMNTKLSAFLIAGLGLTTQIPSNACTGITLKSKDGATVAARTIEWAESAMNNMYVVVPRNQEIQSLTPSGMDGIKFKTKYGFVGLAVEQKEFMVEGINEKGLSGGLFYFPNYGKYQPYDAAQKDKSLADFQLVSYVLAECSTVDEVKKCLVFGNSRPSGRAATYPSSASTKKSGSVTARRLFGVLGERIRSAPLWRA